MSKIEAHPINKSRIEWLDVAKGIGIILVLVCHSIDKNTYMWNMITLFHMPLFYLISGYLFKEEKTIVFLKKKILSLYIPFVCFSLVAYFSSTIIGTENLSLSSVFKILLMYKVPGILGAAWFLCTLFYSEIIIHLCLRLFKIKLNHIIIALFFVSLGIIGFTCLLPMFLSRVLIAVFFIYLGYISKSIDFKRLASRYLLIILWIVGLLTICLCSIKYYSSYSSNIFPNIIVSIVNSIVGSCLIISFSFFICKRTIRIKAIISYLGKNTIGIVFFQFIGFRIINVIIVLVYNLNKEHCYDFPVNYDYNNMFWCVWYVISGIVFSILLYAIYNIISINIVSVFNDWRKK